MALGPRRLLGPLTLCAFLTGTTTLLLAPRTAYGVVLVAVAIISGCWLGVSGGALRDRGLSRRLAIVISFVALDAARVALAFDLRSVPCSSCGPPSSA